MRGDQPAVRARAVEEVALALAIPHLLDRTVDTLSGGELQRVALAAALVTRPGLVLLDEPTSQLDPVAGDELIWLLRRLNEEWGVAVLLAEHRLERCLAAADRVIAMEAGAIAFDGTPGDFLAWSHAADPALTTPPPASSPSPESSRCRSAFAQARQELASRGGGGRGPDHLLSRPARVQGWRLGAGGPTEKLKAPRSGPARRLRCPPCKHEGCGSSCVRGDRAARRPARYRPRGSTAANGSP